MDTTLDLPGALVEQVKLRALREGRELKDVAAELLRIGLASAPAPVVAQALPILKAHPLTGAPFHERAADALPEPVITTDPVTGLPVIHSPPDAPIHRMTAAEFQAVVDAANE